MSWLKRFGIKEKTQKVFVLGLDGTPYTFINELINKKELPNFCQLWEEGTCCSINSVIPPISSVAWASFMTGKNPGNHNIYGFIDRIPSSLEIFIPNSTTMKSEV